jgi:hypothetical protein
MNPGFRQIHNALQSAALQGRVASRLRELAPERYRALRDAPHLRDLLAAIRADAGAAHDAPMPELPFSLFHLFDTTGTRIEYERPYFARRRRLLALTIATLVDDTDEHLPALQDTLWAICDEYTWSLPAHLHRGGRPHEQTVDLFAAETGHSVAEVLTLLAGRLHPWVERRARAEVERRIFQPLFHDPMPFHWETTLNNWAAVCGGAAGMVALLLERDSERLAGMIGRCLHALESFLEGYAEDGGCAEGISYWQYGFGYYVYFAEMLRDVTLGQIDLLAGEKIRRIAAFPAQINLDRNTFVNFSDGAGRAHLHAGLVCRLAARLGAPIPYVDRLPPLGMETRWPHITRDLLWSDPALFGSMPSGGTHFLPDIGWVIDRAELGGVSIAFAAKGGHNAESHNHNDLGHFIIHAGGESLLADLGAGVYTRQYFREQRYEFIHTRSLGHSVPLIAGREQQAGADCAATVLRYEPSPDGVLFALDLTRAYVMPTLRRFTRTFRWTRAEDGGRGTEDDGRWARAELLLTDEFDFTTAPATLEEIFISLTSSTLADGEVRWANDRASVMLTYDAQKFSASVEEIATQTHEHAPIVVQRVRLSAKAPTAEQRCEFRLTVT